MKTNRTTTGLLLIFVLACLGAMLLVIPPKLAAIFSSLPDDTPRWLVYVYAALVGTGALLLLGCTIAILWRLWSRTRRKRARHARRVKNPSELTHEEREREVDENLNAVEDLQAELDIDEALHRELDPLAHKIAEKRESQQLEIVAFGAISSGKSSLLNALAGNDVFVTDLKGGTTAQRNEIPWPGIDCVMLVDTPGLGEVDGAARGAVSASSAKDADLVLLVVDGPLREWEFELLKQLGEMEKRVLICLNKEDWYEADERASLIGQIRQQVKSYVAPTTSSRFDRR